MKKIYLFFLLCGMAQAINAQHNIDVLHYKFLIDLNDDNDSVFGLSVITLVARNDISSFNINLSGVTKDGKGMTVTKISEGGEKSKKELLFKHINESLSITKALKRNDTTTIMIYYRGIPADGLIISKNKYGNRTFFADNWPNRGHHWLPCHDDPADKATVEFIVTAPQHYQVVANGVQIEETNLPGTSLLNAKKRTHWKEDVPVSTKVMVIGVADFAVGLSGVVNDCIPVYSWVYPEDRDKGFYDYALATEILPWFIKNVGPYGYKKLANVQSKTTFGGLENANTIFYSEGSVSGTRKSEALITHEIAHQWFGNMATEKSFAHLWLSEGFATYFTILYMEQKYGKDTAITMLKEDREQVVAFARISSRPVVDETKNYMELLNANSYQKGGWVLHMLRSELGDSVFWKSIRQYYSAYAGKTADSDELQRVFEQVSGKNLAQFFKQWLFTAGIPRLHISRKDMPNEKKVAITVEQLQHTPFHFPLTLLVTTGLRKNKEETIRIRQKKETFYFTVNGPVADIRPDPRTALLFELAR